MEPRYIEQSFERTVKEHKKYIDKSSSYEFTRIVFTQKEPTLSFEKLEPLIKHAKKIGYKDIMIVTNGRLLSYKNFLLKLIKRGVNHFEISLHGENQIIHESLTRTPGSFRQTLQGLKNINALPSKFRINYSINFTITALNYKSIKNFYFLASSFEPSNIVFNFFCAKSEAEKKSHYLMPKFSSVIKELKKIEAKNFSLIDFPLCIITPELKKKVGHIEDFHVLDEFDKSKYLRNDWRALKENLQICERCRFRNICPKPSSHYIDKYGSIEFGQIKW